MATPTVQQQLEAQAASLPRLTWEEYLDWGDAETQAEWVAGEVQIMTRPSLRHQLTSDFLGIVLSFYLDERPVGIKIDEFLMRLPGRPSGRIPDILVVLNEHRDRLQEKYCDGPADVVIEITSPETAGIDRGTKFTEYEAAGVAEYWLLDPLRRMADFYRLGKDDLYSRVQLADDGRFYSAILPGFQLDPDWLWQDPTPSLKEALAWVQAMLAE